MHVLVLFLLVKIIHLTVFYCKYIYSWYRSSGGKIGDVYLLHFTAKWRYNHRLWKVSVYSLY